MGYIWMISIYGPVMGNKPFGNLYFRLEVPGSDLFIIWQRGWK